MIKLLPAVITVFLFSGCAEETIKEEGARKSSQNPVAAGGRKQPATAIAPVTQKPNVNPDPSNQDFEFTVEDGPAVITKYNGVATNIVIPETLGGKPVVAIQESAFTGNSAITSVSLPESITRIGSNAFNGCSGLANITIPARTRHIGENAFDGCSNLSSIVFVGETPNIKNDAFAGSYAILYVDFSMGSWKVFEPSPDFFGHQVKSISERPQ
ncbi:MAG: leucine-rich repeat domain-containing protein [Verrucomicrobiales bacterium]